MRTLLSCLFAAAAVALATCPVGAEPNGGPCPGHPHFCDGEPGPPGNGGHHNVTNTATSSAVADADASATAFGGNASQEQGQSQMQMQQTVVDASSAVAIEGSTINVEGAEVNAGADVVVEGDRVEALEADDLPGIPASVFVDACGNGLAAGFPGGSASFGAGNPVCLWLAIGRAAHDLGDRERADRALGEAEASLRRQRSVSRYLEGVPLVGRLF